MGLFRRPREVPRSVAIQNNPRSWEPGFVEALQATKPAAKSQPCLLPGTPAPQTQELPSLDALCASLILGQLSPREVARAQVRNAIAAFQRHWDLASVTGLPRTWSVAEAATEKSFVLKAPLVKGDSLAMLAVRHATDIVTLKRLNNLTSDSSLAARHYIFVPCVGGAAAVRGSHVTFTYCPIACREFITLQPGAEEGYKPQTPAAATLSPAQVDQLTAKLALLLSRSLRVDEQTALYYLREADNDVKRAMQLHGQWGKGLVSGPSARGQAHCLGK
ncbi:hypothetical protein QJQ45_024280, partial [Haematococcus lacustris]